MPEFFSAIRRIAFEGPKSKNPLAFNHYNPWDDMASTTDYAAARWG